VHRITLKDIAREAGISVSCVARALKGRPDISAATCLRVQEIARRLDYQVDPALAALSAYRHSRTPGQFRGTLAYVTTHQSEQEYLASSEGGDLLRGARARAHSLGYKVEYINAGTTKAGHRQAARVLRARGIHGLLLRSYPLPMQELSLPLEDFHSIDLFSEPHHSQISTVSSNHVQAMETVLVELFRRGFQCPGLVLREALSTKLHHGWLMSFRVHAARHFARSHEILFHDDTFTFDLLPQWTRDNHVDVLILCMTENAIAARLSESYVPLPENVGSVCMDLINPACGRSGIYQDRNSAGAIAVDWLQSMLTSPNLGTTRKPTALMIPGTWQDGFAPLGLGAA
jgi:DNA-binding LacI/PurR family transcriptional regulator